MEIFYILTYFEIMALWLCHNFLNPLIRLVYNYLTTFQVVIVCSFAAAQLIVHEEQIKDELIDNRLDFSFVCLYIFLFFFSPFVIVLSGLRSGEEDKECALRHRSGQHRERQGVQLQGSPTRK